MIFKFENHEIELYGSIQTLPIQRFQKFNKYQMIASEIGDTFEDYVARTQEVSAFLAKNMIEEAKQALNNRAQTVYNAFNEQSPRGKAFAVLVRRIDSVKYDKFAPDDIEQIEKHLNDIGFDTVTSVDRLREVKKKSRPNFKRIFRLISRVTGIGKKRRSDTTSSSPNSTI